VLLAAAGLLIRTLIHLESMPPGFNPSGVITAKASLDDVRYYEPATFRKLLNRSLAGMREIPGVQNASVGLTCRTSVPCFLVSSSVTARRPDRKLQPTRCTSRRAISILCRFRCLEAGRSPIRTHRIRSLSSSSTRHSHASFFRGTNPVGRSLLLPFLNQDNKNKLIVGVVADTVLSSAAKLNSGSAPLTSEEAIYLPAAQLTDGKSLSVVHAWFQPSWIVRTARPVAGLTAQMQSALASADPNLPFSGFYDMKDLMAATLATQRIEVALLAAMASLALLLSAVVSSHWWRTW